MLSDSRIQVIIVLLFIIALIMIAASGIYYVFQNAAVIEDTAILGEFFSEDENDSDLEYIYPEKIEIIEDIPIDEREHEPFRYSKSNVPLDYSIGEGLAVSYPDFALPKLKDLKGVIIPVVGYQSDFERIKSFDDIEDDTALSLVEDAYPERGIVFVCAKDCVNTEELLPRDIVAVKADGDERLYYKITQKRYQESKFSAETLKTDHDNLVLIVLAETGFYYFHAQLV